MPELPEVETTLRGIAPHIENQTVHHLIIRQPRLRWPVPDNLEALISGCKIRAISRRAKYLLFDLGSGSLIIHLGMSGSLRILTEDKTPEKHDHLDFVFINGVLMRFHDPRRFGSVLWTELPVNQHPLLKSLGPEPLLSDFDGNYLYQLSNHRMTPVKSFIMDSHVVVGVGNIYANEALFMAGIHPTRPAGRISLQRYRLLASNIKTVLQNAIEQGGTTLRNFVNETGNPGYFKQKLRVYGRAGQPCLICQKPLTEIRMNNRTTVFCSKCQK
jgi:formamidopyrimidine-DNA glycosylase